MYIQIVGGRIYTPTGWIDGGSVLVEGKKIKAILNTDLPIEGARQMLEARTSSLVGSRCTCTALPEQTTWTGR